MNKLITLLLLNVCLFLTTGCKQELASSTQTALVKKGNLTVSLEVRGELEAEKSVKVRRPRLYGTRGSVKIINLVPEGTDVKAGDLLVELDKADLKTNRKKAESEVKEETADLEKANKTLQVERDKLQAEVDKVKADLEIKQLQLGLIESLPTTSDIVSAQTELETAQVMAKIEQEDYSPTAELFNDGHVPLEDLEIAELELKQAQIDLKRKQIIHDLVMKGADDFEKKRARLEVGLAQVALSQAQTRLEYEAKKLEEEITAAQADLKLAQKELERCTEAVDAADVKAPCAGTVVYARVWQSSGEEKITEGTAVWTHSHVISLPDLHTMVAKVWIEESQIRLIKEGQRATLNMDAIKDTEFHGEVIEIGNVTKDKAETRGRSSWLYGRGETSGIRVFEVKVRIDEHDERIRPGLNGNVKIIAEKLEDVLSIPVAAVFRGKDGLVAYVKEGRRFVARPIKTGKTAEGRIVILSGLKEGERVSLMVPEELQ